MLRSNWEFINDDLHRASVEHVVDVCNQPVGDREQDLCDVYEGEETLYKAPLSGVLYGVVSDECVDVYAVLWSVVQNGVRHDEYLPYLPALNDYMHVLGFHAVYVLQKPYAQQSV